MGYIVECRFKIMWNNSKFEKDLLLFLEKLKINS
jgi:hypothetical protein